MYIYNTAKQNSYGVYCVCVYDMGHRTATVLSPGFAINRDCKFILSGQQSWAF